MMAVSGFALLALGDHGPVTVTSTGPVCAIKTVPAGTDDQAPVETVPTPVNDQTEAAEGGPARSRYRL